MGSGSGKGVICASLLYPFTQCIGIEYLEDLHSLAMDVHSRYTNTINNIISEYSSLFDSFTKPVPVTFKQGDFLNEKWHDASLILCNSTCFNVDLMTQIGKKVNKECESGTIVITFTKRIPGLTVDWEIKEPFRRLMSWGIATIYIHRRISC